MPGPTETEFFDRADMGDTPIYAADKDDHARVAKDGFEALMTGKDHVVGGALAKQADGRRQQAHPRPDQGGGARATDEAGIGVM